MLEVRGLRKAYGDTVALDGVDLDVARGEIVGLLGPNGAGKTTLVSIVAGLRRADAGTVRVGEVDALRNPERAQQLIGLAPQETGVYLPLTVRDNLRFFGELAGLRGARLRDAMGRVASALGLDELIERRASTLSGGERRRLHTAMALVHSPELVLLDEPTTGADVRTRTEILELVRHLAENGSAVVYSTHYLHEIEELGATVAIIDYGRTVARGALADLIVSHGSTVLELTFRGPVPTAIAHGGGVVEGNAVRITTPDPGATAAEVLARLGPDASSLRSLEVLRPSLESVFLALTGRRYERDDHEDAPS